jgi:DTW domain-containing protein YfiP
VDGTWITARKTMQRSANLRNLPQICFDPPHPSRIRLRKQPKEYCFSTVEAIHHTIELLGVSFGFDTNSRRHDHLLEIFDQMVEQQIQLMQNKPRFLERSTAR